jgi:hypothetical protein
MDLGLNKCGIMLWPSICPKIQHAYPNWVIDLDNSDVSLIASEAEKMKELKFQHDHINYNITDRLVLTVKSYKYLGIIVNPYLSDLRKIISGIRLMELDYAYKQANKGLRKLHILQPCLIDQFCPSKKPNIPIYVI